MKIAKTTFKIIATAGLLYISVFAFWFLLSSSCLDYADEKNYSYDVCSQDSFSKMVRTTHAPLIDVMLGSNKKSNGR